MAVDDSELSFEPVTQRIGVFTGTAIGGQAWAFRQYEIFKEKGIKRISPFTAVTTFPERKFVADLISLWAKRPKRYHLPGCVSSTVALGYGFENIRIRGDIDVALVGGTEAPLHPGGIFGAYCAARVMTTQ